MVDDAAQASARRSALGSASSRLESGDDSSRLDTLLATMASVAEEQERVSVGDIVAGIGDRSFSPLMLVAGLVILTPVIGDIPGVPILMGTIVIFVAGQIVLRRDRVWLPRWLAQRAAPAPKLHKALQWLRKPARFIDRWTRPRCQWAVRRAAVPLIAAVCMVIAAATPIMEVVPFSANLAGIAITAFSLALFRRDGLMALGAAAFSLAAIVLIVKALV